MLRDDDIRSIGFESGLLHIKGTTVTRWKDGIDLDFPVLAVEKFASAVEQAAYERAAQECDGFSGASELAMSVLAKRIRKLAQEQPK